MNLFLWNEVLNQQQRDELRAKGIFKGMFTLNKEYEHGPSFVYSQWKISDSVPTMTDEPDRYTCQSHNDTMLFLQIWQLVIKKYKKRPTIAHPPVTRTDFLSYLHASYPDLERELRPISRYQRHDHLTGMVDNIFVDDDETIP
jgi:hypothetical protein